jgi:alpha-1,2-mannosyltransferase
MRTVRWWQVLAGVAGVALAWALSTRMPGLDLAVYRRGARALLDGHDPFATRGDRLPFVYPPFSALVFVPLGLLSQQVALVVMTALSLGSLVFIVAACSRAVWPEPTPATRRATVVIALLLAVSDPVLVTLRWGQINLVLMALVVGDLLRPAGSRTRGVGIGLAAGLKLIPGLFIVYLLATRRFRAAAVAAGTFAATVVIGVLALPGESVTFWLRGSATDPGRFPVPTVGNQSLLGTFARLTGAEGTKGWWLVLAVPVAAASLRLAVLVRDRFGELAAISVVGLATRLVSPIGWNHYFAWFALPVFVLAGRWIASRSRPALALAVVWSAVFVAAPFWWLPQSQWAGRGLSIDAALLASTYCIVTLAALLAMAVYLRRTQELVDLTELVEIDLREPVSPVVARPVVLRRTLVPFDPFDPPPAFARRTVRN